MLNVAIIEDDPIYAQQLQQYIERYNEENHFELCSYVFEDGLTFLEHYHQNFDILLMDIEMPLLDGMSTAFRIREQNLDIVIIFITNMAQYAIKGYEVGALDFILKPVSYTAFALKIQKAIRQIEVRSQSYLLVPIDGAHKRIAARSIFYIEVFDHRLQVHTDSGVYTVFSSLNKIEGQLSDQSFFRSNKCYLVNLRYVDEFRGNTVVVAGQTLRVSRPRRKEFQLALMNYYGGIQG